MSDEESMLMLLAAAFLCARLSRDVSSGLSLQEEVRVVVGTAKKLIQAVKEEQL